MPQLDISTYLSQAFWLLLSFILLWILLSVFITPKIADIIEQRKRKIDDYLQKAEIMNNKAKETNDRYNTTLNAAKNAAENNFNEGKEHLDNYLHNFENKFIKELSSQLADNEFQLAKQKKEILQQAEDLATDLAFDIVQKLGFTHISRQDIRGKMTEATDILSETGEKLIDATQNVIMDAAENVSQVIETAAEKSIIHEPSPVPFYTEIEFWVGLSFVLTILLLYKFAGKLFKNLLLGHSQKVVSEIEEAVKLRDDAQKLLAKYERQALNLNSEAEQIFNESQKNLQNLKNRKTADLKKKLRHKQQETALRISAATEKNRSEINAVISLRATELAHKAIEQYINNTEKSLLIDEAIADLDKIITSEN